MMQNKEVDCDRVMNKETFYPTNRLSEVIEADYRMMQVVCRFGIAMGFADKTISEVCHERGVDVHTFLAVINTVSGHLQSKSKPISLDLIDVRALLEYLKRTHTYLLHHQLPRMRRNLLGAIDCSGTNDVVFLLLKYFDMYVAEVRKHVAFEESEVYAYAECLLDGKQGGCEKKTFHRHNDDFVSRLHELINVFLQYCTQDEGRNDALNEVVYNIYRIEDDISIHCRIEDEMLMPLIHRLEHRRPRTITADNTDNKTATATQSPILSDREQDVAVCVAKGMSNKEIAEQLFLSVNTVTTHRRNIARKLNIHSAAGIAIYCVVRGLVKLEEIKI